LNDSGIAAVIFDWAGTLVDFGCFAPTVSIVEVFAGRGVALTMSEARGPMGLEKKEHIRRLLALDSVGDRWREATGTEPSAEDAEALYEELEPRLAEAVKRNSRLVPGTLQLADELHVWGTRIGSTTGYLRPLMNILTAEASRQGFTADAVVCPSDVPAGRPYPWMCFRNAVLLDAYPPRRVVKIGDTPADMREGLNAGMWTVGVTLSGNEVGLSEEEVEQLTADERSARVRRAEERLMAAGAHYVTESVGTCRGILATIEERILRGEHPSCEHSRRESARGRGHSAPWHFAVDLPDNPYVLLTPGPLSTTPTVKAAMLRDWCTWDADYNDIVQEIRRKLVDLATTSAHNDYTSVLMQGSGTFCVEAALGTSIAPGGKLLILANGAYGERMAVIAERLRMPHTVLRSPETVAPDSAKVRTALDADPSITAVALVHCETTTGILNPLAAISTVVRESGRLLIVDAMSSFGGYPMDISALGIDVLISSANKCIQGVPGFGFVIARTSLLASCEGNSPSLSLDLHDQWRTMERERGKWRFTSPTHVVRAFAQALAELETEGGVKGRHARYCANHHALVSGMTELGFSCLLDAAVQSPFITSFLQPTAPGFTFARFYADLKARGFVIYPGKVSRANTFRIGTIGDVRPQTIRALLSAVRDSMTWDCA
jgi:2-aminoethylphosphonate--pyruvate transaminase/phosphonoacetaldehyde hydrolase